MHSGRFAKVAHAGMHGGGEAAERCARLQGRSRQRQGRLQQAAPRLGADAPGDVRAHPDAPRLRLPGPAAMHARAELTCVFINLPWKLFSSACQLLVMHAISMRATLSAAMPSPASLHACRGPVPPSSPVLGVAPAVCLVVQGGRGPARLFWLGTPRRRRAFGGLLRLRLARAPVLQPLHQVPAGPLRLGGRIQERHLSAGACACVLQWCSRSLDVLVPKQAACAKDGACRAWLPFLACMPKAVTLEVRTADARARSPLSRSPGPLRCARL